MMTPRRRRAERLSLAAMVALGVATLSACATGPTSGRATRSTASERAMAACRQRADEVFGRQNRGDVYANDMYAGGQRDAPFGGAGMPGNPTAGLSARYSREKMLDDCLNATAGRPGATPDSAPQPPSTAAPQPPSPARSKRR